MVRHQKGEDINLTLIDSVIRGDGEHMTGFGAMQP